MTTKKLNRKVKSADAETPLLSASSSSTTLDSAGPPTEGFGGQECPERSAWCWSRWTYGWATALIFLGYKRPIVPDDLWALPDHMKAKAFHEEILKYWNKYNGKKNRPLLWSIWKTFSKDYFIPMFFYRVARMSMELTTPILVLQVLNAVTSPDDYPSYYPYLFAGAITVNTFTLAMIIHRFYWFGVKLALGIRGCCMSLVYSKTLKMAMGVRGSHASGSVVNMAGVDADNLMLFAWAYVHESWASPLTIIIAVVLLYILLGYSALIGTSIMVGTLFISGRLSKRMSKLQDYSMSASDKRMQQISELLGAIKLIKLYAWEEAFLNNIRQSREHQLSILRSIHLIDALNRFFGTAVPLFVSLAAFTSYTVLEGRTLNPSVAFSSLLLFTVLRDPLTKLPDILQLGARSWISQRRITEFMGVEEKQDYLAYLPSHRGKRTDSHWDLTALDKKEREEKRAHEKKQGQKTGASRDDTVSWKDVSIPTDRRVGVRVTHACLDWGADPTPPQPHNPRRQRARSLIDLNFFSNPIQPDLPFIGGISRQVSATTDPVAAAIRSEEPSKGVEEKVQIPKMRRAKSLGTDYLSALTNPSDPLPLSLSLLPPEERPTLYDINFSVPPGGLTLVIGQVGCGKSSLLAAMMGEMRLLSGKVEVPKSMSFLGQQPFLLHETVRNNILWGQPYDETRYNATVKACSLLRDFELFPQGDLTEVGENGIGVSGGQRARICLARAVYSDSDLVLLDEPLAAVDAHVAKALFEDCIGRSSTNAGLMERQRRTRMVATHHAEFGVYADHIIILQHGSIYAQGTYLSLLSQGINLNDFAPAIIQEDKSSSSGKPKGEGEGGGQKHEEAPKTEKQKHQNGEVQEEKKAQDKINNRTQAHEEESVKKGSVRYLDYFRAVTSLPVPWVILFWVIVGLFVGISQAANTGSSVFLAYWASNDESQDTSEFEPYIPLSGETLFITAYAALVGVTSVLLLCRLVIIALATHRISRRLHDNIVRGLLHAPQAFFDATPLGRIINRCSKDQEIADSLLPAVIQDIFSCVVAVLGPITLLCIIAPLAIPFIVVLMVLYLVVERLYLPTSRELKRIESVRRSPIYSHFSESIHGLTAIRAYQSSDRFFNKILEKIDNNTHVYFYSFAVNRWLGVRLEGIGSLVVMVSTFLSLYLRESLGAGMVGVAVSSVLSLSSALNWMVRQFSELEVQMNAVERLNEYSTIPSEESEELIDNLSPDPASNFIIPPKSWPEHGKIEIHNLSVAYRIGMDPVLRGVTATIKPGEKVGLVGRTGAGKSTLSLALFRLMPLCEGYIKIDGVDISKIPLNVLRSRLAIIPQDPVLFVGTIRYNVDPFKEHTDQEVWDCLAQVQLAEKIRDSPHLLDSPVEANGDNFSVGERQLICLARAILRGCNIVVMDEATANLDFRTDQLIRDLINSSFKTRTVLTIAHRLHTVLDSDRIMVFDSGRLVEFDATKTLLADEDGFLAKLVKSAQSTDEEARREQNELRKQQGEGE